MNGLPLNDIIHGNCLITSRQFPDKSSYYLRDETTFIFLQSREILAEVTMTFTGKKKTLKGFAL